MSSWLVALGASGTSGGIGVVGVLAGSWLTAHRDDRRWVRELERERDQWHREDERRWAERRRAVYAQYLIAVQPWIRHARYWGGPHFDPETTIETLRANQEPFDWQPVSDAISESIADIELIGSETVRAAARQLHAQLIAFEAICMTDSLQRIGVMAKNCEKPFDRLKWAFRDDLGVRGPEPPGSKPPSRQHSEADSS